MNFIIIFRRRLELNMELPSGPQAASVGASTQVSQEQDELTQRLAKLRQTEWNWSCTRLLNCNHTIQQRMLHFQFVVSPITN